MPLFRRRYRRKTYRRKTRRLGKVAKKQVKAIITNAAERKYHDLKQDALIGPYDSPSVTILNAVAQGDADTQRNGDEITMTSLSIRGFISYENSVAQIIGRLVIVNMLAGNVDLDSTSTVTYDLRNVIDGAAPTQNTVFDFYNHDNRRRFQVLYDRTFGPQNVMGNTSAGYHFQRMIPLKHRKVQFQASGTGMRKNCIVAFWWSNAQIAGGLYPELYLHTRINYIDI